ncbi:tyrosine-type recombinase/integrase [Evansella sp. AB-rgal1]|uniref:tyrosine-type recombinase/integrase n=1 Tax=Evansella sp. AB-rgal1 TaxID=3242696 RepID=UPI00359D572A
MARELKSQIDYEQVCNELGIRMEDLIALAQNGPNVVQEKQVRVTTIINDFLEHLKILVEITKRAETTFTTYENFLLRLKDFINEKNPNLTLQEFNEKTLDKFLRTCKPRCVTGNDQKYKFENEKKLSNNTINKYTAIVRELIKFAYTQDYIRKDLSHRFEYAQKGALLPRYFTDDQIEMILAKSLKRTYGYRWKAMICFMLGTGCRISEVTNLRVKDFDIENDLIYIYDGKGNKDRTVIIYPEVKKIILRYLQTSELKKWDRYNEGFLFARDEGDKREKKISDRSLQYQIDNILHDSFPKTEQHTTHSFRHTFAVNCLKAGMKIEYLSQLLGHTNPSTTSIYVQLLPADLRDEVMTKYPFPVEALLKEII